MPYIDKSLRPRLDASLEYLIEDIQTEGELNYAITRLCKGFLSNSPSYAEYNSVMGVLECAKQEFYRRMVTVYEDEKIKQNGDV